MPSRFPNRGAIPIHEIERRYNIQAKPCPFCLSKNLGIYGRADYYVACFRCGAEGPIIKKRVYGFDTSIYYALLHWNYRGEPVLPHLKEENND